MARPLITTIALVAGVSLTIAGCTTALDSPDADSFAVEAETSTTPAELPEVDSSVLEEFALDTPDEGTDAYIAWLALLGPDGEYAAAAMYQAVIDEFGDIEPYVSIKEGEERHIEIGRASCRERV